MSIINKYKFLLSLVVVSIIILIDEGFKFFVVQSNSTQIDPSSFFQIGLHQNYGVAFNIPFKLPIVIIATLIIFYFLAQIIIKNRISAPRISTAASFIILGGAGNFFDRLYYGYTVDYLIFFGRSAMNLSDMIIILGVILFLFAAQKERKRLKEI